MQPNDWPITIFPLNIVILFRDATNRRDRFMH